MRSHPSMRSQIHTFTLHNPSPYRIQHKTVMKVLIYALVVLSLIQAHSAAANESECITDVEEGKDYFPDKAVVENSKQWTVTYENTYKVVTNIAASESYLLYQCGTPIPEDTDQYKRVFSVPLKDVGVLSTTMIPSLEMLGARQEIAAFLGSASWVSSPCMGELFDEGIVAEVENPYNASTIDETSLDRPSFVEHNGGTALTNEIKVSASEEDENLAVFEWIKFYALFFNLEGKANEIFADAKGRYTCTSENAGLLACDNMKAPVVLWGSYSDFCGGWDVATCPNYYCEFAQSCQAEILSSPDQGSFYSEDCFRNYMTTDEFIKFGKDADIWIYTSPDFENAFTTFEANLTDFVSIQNKLVFDTEGSGAGAWFEQRLAEPDVILQDFCSVVGHEDPNTPVPHERAWFRNVFTEPVGSLGQCDDPLAPLIPKSTKCFQLPSDYCSTVKGATEPPATPKDSATAKSNILMGATMLLIVSLLV